MLPPLSEFLQQIREEQHSQSDFFAALVKIIRYAGPGRLLPAFFPEAATIWANTCYAASEPGWKGSYKNISTRLEKKEGGWHITGSKDFVPQAENIICLAKYQAKPVLILLPFSSLKNLKPLTSQGMPWPTRQGLFRHYRATLDSQVPEEFVRFPRQRDFLLLSAKIPVTEFIGFVWLLLISETLADAEALEKFSEVLGQPEKIILATAREMFREKRRQNSLPAEILPHLEPLWALYDRTGGPG